VGLRVKGKQLLEPTSLSIPPGEMVAIIGESGAGKSTLLKMLCGVTVPSGGQVTLNGEELTTRLTDVGYVPQDDIVHPLLTVREALRYAARLRLPQDVSAEEIEAAVDRVVGELSLEEQADTRIGSLSGGQRKRTGVATELLSRPSVLFLDEPTTGMDPGLETQMMQLFRELAGGGRAVALVTHATKNLALCDRVLVMGRGGVLTFDGPPGAAPAFFGVDDYDGIYLALPTREPAEWRSRHLAGARERPEPPEPAEPTRRRRPHLLPQLRVLVSRYLTLFMRDRRNLVKRASRSRHREQRSWQRVCQSSDLRRTSSAAGGGSFPCGQKPVRGAPGDPWALSCGNSPGRSLCASVGEGRRRAPASHGSYLAAAHSCPGEESPSGTSSQS